MSGDARPDYAQAGDARPGYGSPDDAHAGDARPRDARPDDAQAGDARPGYGSPNDAHAGDPQAGDTHPDDALAGAARSGDAPHAALDQLVSGVLAGKPRAIARAISAVEAGRHERDELLRRLELARGSAAPPRIIGFTGPPGAGKSTLISAVLETARAAGDRIAVLAVDPSSPFSGGALLGDRLRMTRHAGDAGVFIRSMATRGSGGGLSAAALEAAGVLGAAGFDTILLESVGVGQSEVGIMSVADVVVVVLNPGTGDEIQTLKAGVMEIGDLYLVNKADLAGADDLERSLRRANLVSPGTELPPEILRVVATDGTGVPELYQAIIDRVTRLEASGELSERRRRRLSGALEQMAGDLFRQWIRRHDLVNGSGHVPFGEVRHRLSELLDVLSRTMEEHDD
ncbi:MAG: methylmalonyl Co-A mutase-associated GTPase MeaB [Alkalispirochaeta sp.]